LARPGPIIGDKIGRKTIMVWMTGVWGFWTCAAGLAQNFTQLMVFFAFMVTYFVKVRGWTTPQAAVLYTVFMAGFGISGYFGGMFGDMFEKKVWAQGPRHDDADLPGGLCAHDLHDDAD
jgi:MFS family permease